MPCEAAFILWVSEDFNTPLPPPESQCRKQNDYPAIVTGAAGARQQICEPLLAFESWVFRIDFHSSSSFVVPQVLRLWHSKKSSANWRPLQKRWIGPHTVGCLRWFHAHKHPQHCWWYFSTWRLQGCFIWASMSGAIRAGQLLFDLDADINSYSILY